MHLLVSANISFPEGLMTKKTLLKRLKEAFVYSALKLVFLNN